MSQPLLRVEGLRTVFGDGDNAARAVDGIDFTINRGETFALLGESGCGKSMTALSVMRLLPFGGRVVGGRVWLDDVDLMQMPETAMRSVRGRRISMIFQEPQSSLNPVLSTGVQIAETLTRHHGMSVSAARERSVELLDAVGIPDPGRRISEYPHQLSGGMKQRVMIAIALAAQPDLLIADEPTTALDVTIQAQILELLKRLQADTGMAMLLITHDLGVVAEVADHVAVMYAGHIVEQAPRATFFADPAHPYSQKLFQSLPNMSKRDTELAVIEGQVPPLTQRFVGCRFESRCHRAWSRCQTREPAWLTLGSEQSVRCHLYDAEAADEKPAAPIATSPKVTSSVKSVSEVEALLQVGDLRVHFPIRRGLLRRTVGHVRAVDGVDMKISAGMTLALVGESGSGKTTVGKGILQLIKPTDGTVSFDGDELTTLDARTLRRRRADIQFIFQDPYASMNPRMMVVDIIAEGMIAQNIGESRQGRERLIDELLTAVGLSGDAKHRYPHEFSGGQRQRICIARALALKPKLLICDEPTSALDVSVQAQILNLLKKIQDDMGLAYLFITHDLSVVEYLADEVAVLYLGRVVEQGRVDEVLHNPQHPYTRALLSAVPVVDPNSDREIIRLDGDIPSPAAPPNGCHFHPRCAQAMEQCRQEYPSATQFSVTHSGRCFLYGSAK